MFNLGFTELLVLAVIGLLVIGPEQLPIVARKAARMLNQFKHMMDDAMAPVNEFKAKAQEQIDKVQTETTKLEDNVKESVKLPPMGLNDDKPGVKEDD